MADGEQLRTLEESVAAWNGWREANPRIPINLANAPLRRADLRGADLRHANLCGTDLSGADLSGSDLRDAVLVRADLRGTGLRRARLEGADLHMCRGLTQAQVDSAHTDARTRLMPPLQLPPPTPAAGAAPPA